MWIFFTVLCIIILLFIFVIFRKWRITLQYRAGVFTVKAGKIVIYSSSGKSRDDGYIKIPKANFGEIIKKYKALKLFLKKEKQEIIEILKEADKEHELKSIAVSIVFGFGDAAVTGIANGFIWNVISLAVSLTEKYVNIKDKLNIAVTPDYNKKCFNFDFIIIFDTYFFRMLKISKRAKQLYERYNANLKNGGAKENG
jgi:5-bromo-4-chloroindolyl phosphate hydrolysis protein